jgi:hypothetical protein
MLDRQRSRALWNIKLTRDAPDADRCEIAGCAGPGMSTTGCASLEIGTRISARRTERIAAGGKIGKLAADGSLFCN